MNRYICCHCCHHDVVLSVCIRVRVLEFLPADHDAIVSIVDALHQQMKQWWIGLSVG